MCITGYAYLHPLEVKPWIKRNGQWTTAETPNHRRFARMYAGIAGRDDRLYKHLTGAYDQFAYCVADFHSDPVRTLPLTNELQPANRSLPLRPRISDSGRTPRNTRRKPPQRLHPPRTPTPWNQHPTQSRTQHRRRLLRRRTQGRRIYLSALFPPPPRRRQPLGVLTHTHTRQRILSVRPTDRNYACSDSSRRSPSPPRSRPHPQRRATRRASSSA